MDKQKLKKAWEEQSPCCRSCGWGPLFWEIEDDLEETEKPGEYHAHCVSKDDEDSWSHRGYYLYLSNKD